MPDDPAVTAEVVALRKIAELAGEKQWWCLHEGAPVKAGCLCSNCRIAAAITALDALRGASR